MCPRFGQSQKRVNQETHKNVLIKNRAQRTEDLGRDVRTIILLLYLKDGLDQTFSLYTFTKRY